MKGVTEGQRDNTCTSLAGYFLKTHPPDIVKTILYPFADKCNPPFEHQMVDKVVDSVARKEGTNTPIGVPISNIKDIVSETPPESDFGYELSTSCLQVVYKLDDPKLTWGELARRGDGYMSNNRHPIKRKDLAAICGVTHSNRAFVQYLWRRVHKDKQIKALPNDYVQWLNTDWKASLVTVDGNEKLPSLGLTLPFSMEFYVDILEKSTMNVEGGIGTGKTHYELEVASLNLGKMPIRFFFAELGTPRMKVLIRDDYPNLWEALVKNDGSFNLINTDIGDLDVLESLDPNGLNLHDYLRMGGGERWWLKMQLALREMATRLEDGCLISTLQKPKNRDIAFGGEGIRFQCETAVTLHERENVPASGDNYGYKLCRLDIEKARDWNPLNKTNPESMSVDYRTGGLRGKLLMVENSWGLTSEKIKRDKRAREG